MREKKIIQCLLVLLVTSTTGYAQSLTGRIVDTSKLAVDFANVVLLSLPDSTFLQGTITNEKGDFSFQNIDTKEKCLQISYLGYETLDLLCSQGDVGTLVLHPASIMLEEAVITGRRPTHILKGNSLTTNIEHTLLSNIGTGSDVLKRIPGIRVGQDKSVEVFGKGAPLVYINNRLVRDNQELEQLNSNEIVKIELITNPGAEYDATVKAVLRIKTAKPIGEGFGGYVRGTGSYMDGWAHSQQVNLNYRKGGFDLFGTVRNTAIMQKQDESIQMTLYGEKQWNIEDKAIIDVKAKNLTAQVGSNFVFNEQHAIGMTYDLTRSPYSNDMNLYQDYNVYQDGLFYDQMNSSISMLKRLTTHKVNAYYGGKAGKLAIDFNFDYLYGTNKNGQYTVENSMNQESRIVTSLGNASYHLVAGKLLLSYPIAVGTIKLGTEMSQTDRKDSYSNKENVINSSESRTEEKKIAGFASFGTPIGKTYLDLGLRYEFTKFDYYENEALSADQSRKYSNIFPNLSFSFPLSVLQNSLSYTVKTVRPLYSQLNGNVQYSNRFMYTQGNPELKPQTIHDLTFMTGYKFIQFSASYQYVKDFIVTQREPYGDEGSIALSMFQNYHKNERLNLMLSASPKFSFWEPSMSLFYTQQFFETQYKEGTIKHNNPMAYFTFDNDFVLPKKYIFSVSIDYHTAGSVGVEQQISSYSVGAELRKSFLDDRLLVNLKGTDLFHTIRMGGTQYSRYCTNSYKDTYNSRGIQLLLTYRFNTSRSKYRGTGAANEEMKRL